MTKPILHNTGSPCSGLHKPQQCAMHPLDHNYDASPVLIGLVAACLSGAVTAVLLLLAAHRFGLL